MVDWTSPEVLARNAAAFSKLAQIISGIYLWEFFISLDFEWSFITKKRRFNWPMIPYFLGRYSALGMVIIVIIANDVTTWVNCQALIPLAFVFGGPAFGFASINLAIRTMIVWNMKWYCVVPLCLFNVVQWVIIVRDIIGVKGAWKQGYNCQVTQIWAHGQSAGLLASIVFDFVVLMLNVYKLYTLNGGRKGKRSQLVNIMFRDGIIYFVVSVLVNIPSAVMALLPLNPTMDVMGSSVAAVFATIAASRVVRRLSNFSTDGPAIYMTTTRPPATKVQNVPDVIQVQMDVLTSPDASSKEVVAFEKKQNSSCV